MHPLWIEWEGEGWSVNRFSRMAKAWLRMCHGILPLCSKNGNGLLVSYPPSTDAAQSVPFLGTKQWVLKNNFTQVSRLRSVLCY